MTATLTEMQKIFPKFFLGDHLHKHTKFFPKFYLANCAPCAITKSGGRGAGSHRAGGVPTTCQYFLLLYSIYGFGVNIFYHNILMLRRLA